MDRKGGRPRSVHPAACSMPLAPARRCLRPKLPVPITGERARREWRVRSEAYDVRCSRLGKSSPFQNRRLLGHALSPGPPPPPGLQRDVWEMVVPGINSQLTMKVTIISTNPGPAFGLGSRPIFSPGMVPSTDLSWPSDKSCS